MRAELTALIVVLAMLAFASEKLLAARAALIGG
jgi:hypothetical protein